MVARPATEPRVQWEWKDVAALAGVFFIGLFLSSIYFPLVYLWAGLVLLFLVRYG